MSWDESRYIATCSACGHEGIQVSRSNDHGETVDWWEGFEAVPASEYEYHRKRSERYVPICKCKSQSIVIGPLIGQ